MLGFEKFGKHGYVSQSKITPIIEYLEKGELMGTRCEQCDSLYFPPRSDCSKCRSGEMAWVPVNKECKLVTFTEVYFSPPNFQKETPYLLGLAEMKHGARVFAPINSDIQRGRLAPGLSLFLLPAKEGNGVFYRLEKSEPPRKSKAQKQS